ncbi:MAG TPA: hypothetical protein DEB40_04915 [Elusimicrobia bacterium]|nr:hypothetical protein [Elusimicrobiota bacterium]HBT61065.1 hypothetical protein [Elusimicrobiota bacterium]
MTRLAGLALLLLLAAPAALRGAAAIESDSGKLQPLYEKAFNYYRSGDYAQAIQLWNDILRLDPAQKTARQMIGRIRMEIMRKNSRKLSTLFSHVNAGRYHKALLALQSLIEEDPTHSRYQTLQSALEEISAVLPRAPTDTKAWRMAVVGLGGILGPRENPRLAHNGLRYAMELDPNEARFQKLYNCVLARHPELAGTDAVTPGMKFMEYKQLNAINYIYDAKYNLAVDTLNEILTLEPRDLLALKRLGSAYYSLGHRDKARQAWTRALRLAPDDPQLKKFLKKLASVPARRKARQKE